MSEALGGRRRQLRTLYLDTSFLSQFAKLDVRPKSVPDAPAWRELLTALRTHARDGTVLCPASEFQVDEALLTGDVDLIREVNAIQHELSHGYSFRYWWETVVHQTAHLVLTYMGAQRPFQKTWSAVVRRTLVSLPPDRTRADKEDVRSFLDGQREAVPAGRSYEVRRELEKQDLVHQLFLAPDNLCFRMLLYECGVGQRQFPMDFFDSECIDRIAYVDIFCSITASLAVHERTRTPRGSDLFDTPAIATVLPYCDVVTTDKNMQTHVVRRLHYDGKYDAQILAPTTAGVAALLEML